MIHKKLLSLLVLLMTAASGAWADIVKVMEITSDLTGTWPSDNVNIKATELPGFVPVSLDEAKATAGSLPTSGTVYLFYAFDGGKACYAVFQGGSYQRNGAANQTHSQVKMTVASAAKVYYTYDPDAVAVSTNDAEGETTFTEATFTMPAYDATVDYELVRDMSVSMTTKVGDGADGADYRIRLKKKDDKWEPADLTVAQVMGKFKVHDALENKDLTFYGEGAVCSISIFALDADDKPTGKAIAFADLVPGRYVAIATAADGTAYDGQTPQSNVLVLFQGYEVTVPAKEFVTYYKDENLKLESETSSDGELYTISTVNDDKAVLSAKRDIVPANVAMLIYNPTDVAKTFLLIPTDETPASFMSYQYFIGTLTASTIAASTSTQNNYAFNGKEFVWVKNEISVGANKAWLAIPTTVPAGTRSISIVFGDGTTGIEAIDNGQWSMDNGQWYDLNGRKLDGKPTRKGVYIQNGKKVVVK